VNDSSIPVQYINQALCHLSILSLFVYRPPFGLIMRQGRRTYLQSFHWILHWLSTPIHRSESIMRAHNLLYHHTATLRMGNYGKPGNLEETPILFRRLFPGYPKAMLIAFLVLLLATLIGVGLVALRLAETPWWPHWSVPALHGLVGTCGLVLVVIGLSHSAAASGFGKLAASFLAGALSLGLLFLARIRKGYPLLLAAHASLAITGLVILAAYRAMG
jgi:hypothetical protein